MKNQFNIEPHIVYTMAMRNSDWTYGKVIKHLIDAGMLALDDNGYYRATQTIEITCASHELVESFYCAERINAFNEFLVFPEHSTEYGNVIIIQRWDDDKAEDYSDYI